MNRVFDMVYVHRALSAPMDIDRGFSSLDSESLDAPKCIPCGSTEAVDGCDDVFVTRFHFRAEY